MQLPHPKRWLILFVILAAECMDLLDGTVVNVAAPTIHHDLHASIDESAVDRRRLPAGARRRPADRRPAFLNSMYRSLSRSRPGDGVLIEVRVPLGEQTHTHPVG